MKPVNLLPGNAPVAASATGKPNLGMIGGALFGILAIVGVAGYFAMARVDSVKSETSAADAAAQKATSDTAATRIQIQSIGQPVVDSDKQLAQGAEQVLVAAYTERHDFIGLAQELRGIMQGTGGWYESIKASPVAAAGDTGTAEGGSVEIVGYMPTEQLAASFEERVKATRTMTNVSYESLASETLTSLGSKKEGVYWKFTISADLVDTVAPGADGAGAAAPTDATGTTVAGDGAGDSALTLSLEPERVVVVKKAPAKPAAPRNPFDVAATAAQSGGA